MTHIYIFSQATERLQQFTDKFSSMLRAQLSEQAKKFDECQAKMHQQMECVKQVMAAVRTSPELPPKLSKNVNRRAPFKNNSEINSYFDDGPIEEQEAGLTAFAETFALGATTRLPTVLLPKFFSVFYRENHYWDRAAK